MNLNKPHEELEAFEEKHGCYYNLIDKICRLSVEYPTPDQAAEKWRLEKLLRYHDKLVTAVVTHNAAWRKATRSLVSAGFADAARHLEAL